MGSFADATTAASSHRFASVVSLNPTSPCTLAATGISSMGEWLAGVKCRSVSRRNLFWPSVQSPA